MEDTETTIRNVRPRTQSKRYQNRDLYMVVIGHGAPRVYRPSSPHVRIGRSKGHCDLVLNDPTVSRVHAKVEISSDSTVLIDVGSKNGLFFYGLKDRVGCTLVVSGDIATIGNTGVAFVEGRPDDQRIHGLVAAYRAQRRLGGHVDEDEAVFEPADSEVTIEPVKVDPTHRGSTCVGIAHEHMRRYDKAEQHTAREVEFTSAPTTVLQPSLAALTHRQQEIAKMAAQGISNNEIALACRITPHTVKTHLKNIYRTLGLSGHGRSARVLLANLLMDAQGERAE